MHGYTHHRRAQDTPVKDVSGLINLEDCAFLGVIGLRALDRLMKMRIEALTDRLDALHAEFGEIIDELLVNQLETFAVIVVRRFAVSGKRVFETVDDGYQSFDDARGGTFRIFGAFLLDALAIIFKVGLAAQQRLPKILQIAGQPGDFGVCGR